MSNVSSESRLAIVGFTSTNGMQSNSATERIIVNTLLIIFMTHLRLFSTALTGVAVSTVLGRGLALSSDFACRLLLNFYPRFQVSYPSIKIRYDDVTV